MDEPRFTSDDMVSEPSELMSEPESPSISSSPSPETHFDADGGEDEEADVEVVDINYRIPSGRYKITSSDGVTFYVPGSIIRQSSAFYCMIKMCHRPMTQGISLYDPDFETAPALRLLFDLLSDEHDLRLDGLPLPDWPLMGNLTQSLRLAHKYEFTAAYKIVVGHIQFKLYYENIEFQALHVFRTAAQLEDDILANASIEAMKRHSDTYLARTLWEGVEHGRRLPAMQYYPGTWDAELFDEMPKAYLWALMRATLPRVAPAYPLGDETFGMYICSQLFSKYLKHYRSMERRQVRKHLRT